MGLVDAATALEFVALTQWRAWIGENFFSCGLPARRPVAVNEGEPGVLPAPAVASVGGL